MPVMTFEVDNKAHFEVLETGWGGNGCELTKRSENEGGLPSTRL